MINKFYIPVEETIEFSAEDRVKLSIHPDGFIQFSGENPQKIISGRQSENGDPKGLGLFTNPLSHPIESGPTFGLVLFHPSLKLQESFYKNKTYYQLGIKRLTPN